LIFATVGSSQTPFERLVKAVDELAKKLSEIVVIQIGASKYFPETAEYFDFCDSAEMVSLIKAANIVIAHAGFGIITDCIRMKKRMILIPREHRFGDAEGNQVELAEHLAKTVRGIMCVRDVTLLKNAFEEIKNIALCYQFTNKIPELVQNFIDRTQS